MIATALVSCVLVLGPQSPDDSASNDPFERRTLSNGVQLCVLRVDAPRQAIFTFLPIGLYDDRPGEAQFSHLIEHMLIRGTDPDGLEVGGIRINGETTGDALRLETIGPVETWRDAAARHPRWLLERTFEADVLEREKGRIEGEERGTAANSATGKWAQAAWSQIVRADLEHAAVHGDVAEADVEGLRAAVAARVHLGAGVRIVASGPVTLDELARALEQGFASAPEAVPASAAAGALESPAHLFRPGLREASWDLDAAHYMEWYPLPDASAHDSAFALLLENRVTMALMGAGHEALKGGRALAETRLRTAGARALMISVPVAEDVDLEALQAAIRAQLEPLRAEGAHQTLALAKMQYAFQLSAAPDFAALRERFAGSPAADTIEAQTALTWSMLELSSGLSLPELHAALNSLELAAYGPVLTEALAEGKRCALMLAP